MFRGGRGAGGNQRGASPFCPIYCSLPVKLYVTSQSLIHREREGGGGGTDRQTGTETEKREGTVESTRKIDIEKAELLKVDEAYSMY